MRRWEIGNKIPRSVTATTGQRNQQIGRRGNESIYEQKQVKPEVFKVSEGQRARRLTVANGCRLAAVLVADVTETLKGARYAEPLGIGRLRLGALRVHF
jgi:hypothetical protein